MSKLQNNPRLIAMSVGLAAGLLIVAYFNLGLVVLLLSLAACYILLHNTFRSNVLSGVMTRCLLVVVFYIIILQAVILSAWPIYHNFPLRYSLLVTFIILLLSVSWKYFFKLKSITNLAASQYNWRRDMWEDSACLFIGVVITLLVLIGPIRHSGGFSADTAVNYINTSLDDSNHLSRINDRIQLDRGVLADTDEVSQVVLSESVSSYPPGWHSANAVIMEALWPNIKVGSQTLVAYVVAKTFWLFVLVFFFIKMIFIAYRRYFASASQRIPFVSVVWLVGASTFFAYYSLLEQFKEGFFSFIPQLTLLLIAGLLLIQKDSNDEDTSFVLVALTAVGVTLSWILALPALFAAVIVAYFMAGNAKQAIPSAITILRQCLWYAPIIAISLVSILVQIYLILTTNYRSFSAGINDPGAISIHSEWYYVFLAIGLGCFFAFSKTRKGGFTGLSGLLTGLLGFALFIYLFQLLTIGKTEYYSLKTLNTFVIVALPLAIVGMLVLISRFHDGLSKPAAALITIMALTALPITLGVNPLNTSNLEYIRGNRDFTAQEDAYIRSSLDKRSAIVTEKRKEDVIFYTPANVGRNIVASNILRSIQHIDRCDDKAFTALLQDSAPLLVESVATCTLHDRELIIVTRKSSFEEVKKLFSNQSFSGKVKIIAVS